MLFRKEYDFKCPVCKRNWKTAKRKFLKSWYETEWNVNEGEIVYNICPDCRKESKHIRTSILCYVCKKHNIEIVLYKDKVKYMCKCGFENTFNHLDLIKYFEKKENVIPKSDVLKLTKWQKDEVFTSPIPDLEPKEPFIETRIFDIPLPNNVKIMPCEAEKLQDETVKNILKEDKEKPTEEKSNPNLIEVIKKACNDTYYDLHPNTRPTENKNKQIDPTSKNCPICGNVLREYRVGSEDRFEFRCKTCKKNFTENLKEIDVKEKDIEKPILCNV